MDLSLRSSKIPSKVVAAFVKRLARLMVTEGHCNTQNDKMYVLSFIANIIKRHPRCIRLLHRTKKVYKEQRQFQSDPYLDEEIDPMNAHALESSLWELDSLLATEIDESVKNYAKLFKGDLSRKTSFYKCEEFIE